jgi:hypothetical protein
MELRFEGVFEHKDRTLLICIQERGLNMQILLVAVYISVGSLPCRKKDNIISLSNKVGDINLDFLSSVLNCLVYGALK